MFVSSPVGLACLSGCLSVYLFWEWSVFVRLSVVVFVFLCSALGLVCGCVSLRLALHFLVPRVAMNNELMMPGNCCKIVGSVLKRRKCSLCKLQLRPIGTEPNTCLAIDVSPDIYSSYSTTYSL